MYLCILDCEGRTKLHQNLHTDAALLFDAVFPCLEVIVIGVECMFAWYWIADFCRDHMIPFVSGHAFYMKAIHGSKTKNDKLDSYKIAKLLMGGNMPIAYPYPAKMRATRDLLRRRTNLVRQRGLLLAHIQNTNTQYNMPSFGGKKISRKFLHEQVAERSEDPSVNLAIQTDLTMIDAFNKLIKPLEGKIEKIACEHDPKNLYLLKSVPVIGPILALTILYEVKAKKFMERLSRKYNKSKALGIYTHKLGRAIFFVFENKTVFDMQLFFSH